MSDKKIKLIAVVLFVSHLLASCSSLQTSQNYLLNKSEGLVFFSMTQSGILSSRFQLKFINEVSKADYVVNLRKGDKFEIGFDKNDPQANRLIDNPVGKMVILRLPEGVYSLSNWSAEEKKATGKHSLSKMPNRRFRVSNGRPLYLGNLHLQNTAQLSSFFIMDNRARDLDLFYKHYPRVEKNKLLVASKAFLNPAEGRSRVFEAYTNCSLKDYGLYSKKRLPPNTTPFRTLRIKDKDKKVSRIDGYRLKYASSTGQPELNMKIELSDAKSYLQDKKVITEWFNVVVSKNKDFEIVPDQKGYFLGYQLKTNSLHEKNMIYMVTMFDDSNQIISNMTFVNPKEYRRSYKTVADFMPLGIAAVSEFQQCVVNQLSTRI